jgi:hypothetical protein
MPGVLEELESMLSDGPIPPVEPEPMSVLVPEPVELLPGSDDPFAAYAVNPRKVSRIIPTRILYFDIETSLSSFRKY